MLIRPNKSVYFKEAHTENDLMHSTKTFAVMLLQIVVSDVSPKQVVARILLIELTTIINFSRLNVNKNAHLWRHKSTGVLLLIKSRCEMQTAFGTLKNHI